MESNYTSNLGIKFKMKNMNYEILYRKVNRNYSEVYRLIPNQISKQIQWQIYHYLDPSLCEQTWEKTGFLVNNQIINQLEQNNVLELQISKNRETF